MAAKVISVDFVREKETKNAVRFEEKEQAGKPKQVGSIYIQKWAAGDAKNVTATIQFK